MRHFQSHSHALSAAIIAGLLAVISTAQPLSSQAPASTVPPLDAGRLARIDPLVEAAIKDHHLPGAVVLVGRRDSIVYRKAFGNRALEPSVEAMTLDTIFDLASLTKVVATTTSAMILIEEGRIRLNDRVSSYIPGFERYGKGAITIRHLMTHVSGLRPDLDMTEEFSDSETAIARSKSCRPRPRASASSTATSTTSCSGTSSGASAG
jgi:CubicO group peptidase (beta-lactamase class C family)